MILDTYQFPEFGKINILITKSNGGSLSFINPLQLHYSTNAKSVPNCQIDMHKNTDIPKTKTPNILQNLDKIDHLQPPSFSHKTVQNSSNRSRIVPAHLQLAANANCVCFSLSCAACSLRSVAVIMRPRLTQIGASLT